MLYETTKKKGVQIEEEQDIENDNWMRQPQIGKRPRKESSDDQIFVDHQLVSTTNYSLSS